MTDPRYIEARELIIGGMTTEKAGNAVGISYSAARKIYEALVYDGVIKSNTGCGRKKLSPAQEEAAYNELLAGKSRNQVAKEFGIGATAICNLAKRMRDAGKPIPPKSVVYPDILFSRSGIRMGRMVDAFMGIQSCDIYKVIDEIQKGCTVAEWLRSLVVDAIAEM